MVEKADTAFYLETPEGIHLRMRPAGAPVRCAAWFIDALIRLSINIGIGTLAGAIGVISQGSAQAIVLISAFLLEWFYPVYFEVYRKGKTPGKKVCQLVVVMENGTAVHLQASLIRNFLRIADFLPFGYFLGFISCLVDKRFRRLGDLAAGTQVIYASQDNIKSSTPKSDNLLRFNIPLNHDEKLAFYSYSDRKAQMSSARQQELAEILTDIHGEKGESAIEHVLAYTNSLHKGQS